MRLKNLQEVFESLEKKKLKKTSVCSSCACAFYTKQSIYVPTKKYAMYGTFSANIPHVRTDRNFDVKYYFRN